jgi:type 1 glutamine amidotransferase
MPRPCLAALSALACTMLVACASAATPSAAPVADARPAAVEPRILVFTRTTGYRHDSIPMAVATLHALGADAGLAVEHGEDPGVFDDARLARYRAVVFANTTGDLLDAGQRASFERFVRAGGGFIGVHAAADSGYAWPWYGELVGAWFASHPPGLQTTRVRFEGRHGPSARAWTVTDELYNYRRNPRPHVDDVVATVDERGYAGGTMGDDHPIAWCHARFGGRAWYTGLGHDPALYADATFRAHLLRGLRYATGQVDDC